MKKIITFSPTDITQREIDEIVNTIKSGWITTGQKTKLFEKKIAEYCNTEKAACLNSATACLEMILKLFDIGKGDEVITTPYTYPSTTNTILHCGAKIIFVDLKENEFNIDPAKIGKAITKKTKAIISVDIAGWPVDYDEINKVIESNKAKYRAKKNTLQEKIEKPIFISDAAHSFGAIYKGKKVGNKADFSIFSFHATKNITSAEGGAVTFNSFEDISADFIYNQLMLLSLHGQSKDAFSKLKAGSWRYTIELAGYKCNMPDLAASIGLIQLDRYEKEILPKRKNLYFSYIKELKNDGKFIIPPFNSSYKESSYHLFPLRINGANEDQRDKIIQKMADKDISLNVHFIPVVMQPYYKKLGFDIKNYPNTFNMYKNEISLPFSSLFSKNDAKYVSDNLKKIIK